MVTENKSVFDHRLRENHVIFSPSFRLALFCYMTFWSVLLDSSDEQSVYATLL